VRSERTHCTVLYCTAILKPAGVWLVGKPRGRSFAHDVATATPWLCRRVSASQSEPFTTAAAVQVQVQLPSALAVGFGRDGGRKRQSRRGSLGLTPRVPGPCRAAGGKVRKRVGGVKPPDATSGRRRPACPPERAPIPAPHRSQPALATHRAPPAIQLADEGRARHGFTLTCARAASGGSDIQLGGR
jgi:hypothetical protein